MIYLQSYYMILELERAGAETVSLYGNFVMNFLTFASVLSNIVGHPENIGQRNSYLLWVLTVFGE